MTERTNDARAEAERLVSEREERRRAGDYAAADDIRRHIAELGYDVRDTPAGPEIGPNAPKQRPALVPEDVESMLDSPPVFDASIQWLVEGWPEDVARGIAAFRRHHPGRSLHQIVVETGAAASAAWPADTEVVSLLAGAGWARSRNAGIRRSLGRIVLVVDGSIEPTGDVVTPLAQALEDPSVGVCGPFGVVTDDLHTFRESEGPVVDAIEGYLMAFRRDVLAGAGLFDERFRFYRAADLELSFRVRDAGLAAVVVPVPVKRHEHRTWAGMQEDDRSRLSRRNFNLFLDRWRGRFDLCTSSPSSPPGEL